MTGIRQKKDIRIIVSLDAIFWQLLNDLEVGRKKMHFKHLPRSYLPSARLMIFKLSNYRFLIAMLKYLCSFDSINYNILRLLYVNKIYYSIAFECLAIFFHTAVWSCTS